MVLPGETTIYTPGIHQHNCSTQNERITIIEATTSQPDENEIEKAQTFTAMCVRSDSHRAVLQNAENTHQQQEIFPRKAAT